MLVSTPHHETLSCPHPANYTLTESGTSKEGKTGYVQIKHRNDNKCLLSSHGLNMGENLQEIEKSSDLVTLRFREWQG